MKEKNAIILYVMIPALMVKLQITALQISSVKKNTQQYALESAQTCIVVKCQKTVV